MSTVLAWENGRPTAVTEFEYPDEDCPAALREELQAEYEKKLNLAFNLIDQSRKPKYMLAVLRFAVGASLGEGATLKSIGIRHGVSKQAVKKEIVTLAEKYGFRKTRPMRSGQSRCVMSQSYYRKQRVK